MFSYLKIVYFLPNTQARATQTTNAITDQKVEICGAVGEINLKNEFTVSVHIADDKNPTAAVAKMIAGLVMITF